MRGEYEAIAAAGVTQQVDCPDLAMGRHIQYADLSVAEFPKAGAAPCRSAEPCARHGPAGVRADASVLG